MFCYDQLAGLLFAFFFHVSLYMGFFFILFAFRFFFVVAVVALVWCLVRMLYCPLFIVPIYTFAFSLTLRVLLYLVFNFGYAAGLN